MRAPPVGIQAFILFPIWQKFNASNTPQIKKENKVLQYDSLTLNLSLQFLFQSHAVLICPSYRLTVCPFLSDCVPTPLCPCSILVLSCLVFLSPVSVCLLRCSQCHSLRPSDPFARFCSQCGAVVPPLPEQRLPPVEGGQVLHYWHKQTDTHRLVFVIFPDPNSNLLQTKC